MPISACYCFSSALTAFFTCSLTAMPLASTNLTPFCLISKVLHTPASTQTNFYTSFYTNPSLHKLAFPQTTFYTNQLLHKQAFTRTSCYANQLFEQAAFTQTTFYTNQLYTTPALGLSAKGQRAGGMPKAFKYVITMLCQR